MMVTARDPAIKLFGKEIPLPRNGLTCLEEGRSDQDLSSLVDACLEAEKVSKTGEEEENEPEADHKYPLAEKPPTTEDPANQETLLESDENPKTPSSGDEKPPKTENDGSDTNSPEQKTLKKPDKILPCPRCKSMDTKFCYYNNYNVNQPRHFCKSCQRYWTAGGTMRNVPVGAGRRKNKNSASSHCRHITISKALHSAQIDTPNGIHRPAFKTNGTVLSFGTEAPIFESVACVLNLAEKKAHVGGEKGDDCSSGSCVTTSNSLEGGERNGIQERFVPQIPCLPGVPCPYPWNTSIPVPAICPSVIPMPFYPAPYMNSVFSLPPQGQQFQGGDHMSLNKLMTRTVKTDPGMESGWADFGQFTGDFGFESGFEMNYGLSRTTSCPAAAISEVPVTATAVTEAKQRDSSVLPEKMSFKKRKADKSHNLKAVAEEEDCKEKRIRGCTEEGESKITEQNSDNDSKNTSNNNNNKRETSADTSKENSKVSEVQKPDYIHVRARRGQATDSHSLAERVRREKISERMKYLQDLVPGCNKITGKAGMLDEIINYVQSLQRQVEFLSMKLAAVNPTLDFNIDNFVAKEVFSTCTSNFPIGVSSEIANPAYLQFNPLQQIVSCSGLEMGINANDMALRRTISTPVSSPETFLDSSCFNHIQSSSAWEANLHNLYGVEFLQGRSPSFQAQQFTGSNEASNLKMEI